jgi:hypothetical protein
MSKPHTLYWIFAIGALVLLWAIRKAIVKSRELTSRMQQREEEFLTRFPEFAGAPDAEQGRRR